MIVTTTPSVEGYRITGYYGIVFGEAGRGFERWNLACPTSYITPALERLGKALRAHADKR